MASERDIRRGLSALARRYGLMDDMVSRLGRLHELLVNDPLASTSIRDPKDVLDEHLADSLAGLEVEAVRSAERIADLGSGAGLPALALAITLPRKRFVLIESSARKCMFLSGAALACTLENVHVVHSRIEEFRDGLGAFDAVTARALGPMAVVAEYGAPLLRVGGTLVSWRGKRNPEDEVEGERAASELGLGPTEIRRVTPFEGALNRHLHLMSKVGETPERFPRRPGMAVKRPLGRGRG